MKDSELLQWLGEMFQDIAVFLNSLWVQIRFSFQEDPIFRAVIIALGLAIVAYLWSLYRERRLGQVDSPKSHKRIKIIEPTTLSVFSSISRFLGRMGAAAEKLLGIFGYVKQLLLNWAERGIGGIKALPGRISAFGQKKKDLLVVFGLLLTVFLSWLVAAAVRGPMSGVEAAIFEWIKIIFVVPFQFGLGTLFYGFLAALILGVLGKLAKLVFLPLAEWLNGRAENLKVLEKEREVKVVEAAPEQSQLAKVNSILPVGLITYLEIVEEDGEISKTGKVFQGFFSNKKTMVLLIDGRGFVFENPQRLRKHQDKAVLTDEEGEEKKVTMEYSEKEVFDQVFGKPPGEKFVWRNTGFSLLSSGSAEAIVKGSNDHLRDQTMAPKGPDGQPREMVNYWLAIAAKVTTVEDSGEPDQEPDEKETLFVEYVMNQWGGHREIIPMYAWIGEEISEDEIRLARAVIEKGEYKPQRPAEYNHQDTRLAEGALQ